MRKILYYPYNIDKETEIQKCLIAIRSLTGFLSPDFR